MKVKFLDLTGKESQLSAETLMARVLEHEIDHLDGILFVDKMSAAERLVHQRKLREMKEQHKGRR